MKKYIVIEAMAHKYLWSLLFFSISISASAQKYVNLNAQFSLIEKNTLKDTSVLVHGDISYNLTNNETKYTVSFPMEETWHFQDSTVTIVNAEQEITRKELAEINQLTIFNKILTFNLKDFGLKESGFTIDEVEESDDSIIVKWTPPEASQPFLDYVITEVTDQYLESVLFYDVDGKAINKTYYEDYDLIKGVPVPRVMKSHFKAQEEEIFKVLILSNVEIY